VPIFFSSNPGPVYGAGEIYLCVQVQGVIPGFELKGKQKKGLHGVEFWGLENGLHVKQQKKEV